MIRRPPRSTLFPTRRSSDLGAAPHGVPDEVVVGHLEADDVPEAGAPGGQHPDRAAGREVPGHQIDLVARSEEHTSELQSRPYLVCRLFLEKKKKIPTTLFTA